MREFAMKLTNIMLGVFLLSGLSNLLVADVIKLSPKMRSEKTTKTITAVSVEAIRSMFENVVVLDKEKFLTLPYVVGFKEEKIVGDLGSVVYIKGIQVQEPVYYLIQPSDELFDPQTKLSLGQMGNVMGKVKLLKFDSVSECLITKVDGPILPGTRLINYGDLKLPETFKAIPANTEKEGVILEIVNGFKAASNNQAILISLGHQDGLHRGELVDVYNKGLQLVDNYVQEGDKIVKTKENRKGSALIYRTFDKVSLALILEGSGSIFRHDLVRSPTP